MTILGLRQGALCATCHEDAFSLLAKCINDEEHFHRQMWVLPECKKCTPSYDWKKQLVAREVFLPASLIKGSAGMLCKSWASWVFGSKPPNDWLQLACQAGQSRVDDVVTWAIITVGYRALIDEVSAKERTGPGCCGLWQSQLRLPAKAADGRKLPGLAWRLYKKPKAADNAETVRKPISRPPGLEEADAVAAEEAEVITQQAAHIEGGVLRSSVVALPHGEHVSDDRTADGDVGARVARTRFPKVTRDKEYLFNNDPEALAAAEALRNQGVGVMMLTPEQDKAFDRVIDALEKHLFTKKRVTAADGNILSTKDLLPKNRNEEQRAQMEIDALQQDPDGTVPFSLLVKAFVKSECTSKRKPRPIANHGDLRVWGIARAAAVFEDLMFHMLPDACIKHCEKREKMNSLFRKCNGFAGKLENDMTAFEFGISARLKKAEMRLLKHIMGGLNMDCDNVGFCHRVVDARDKAVTWMLRYKDAAGADCCMKVKLPRAMRESGDRITSSGNFLQNLIAWLVLLVHPDHIESAVMNMINRKGGPFTYVSARDGKRYKAYLAFEGDDTLGALDERVLLADGGRLVDEFFSGYGWNAKLKVVKPKGDDTLNFVGYTALCRNNEIVSDCENVVMFPEIKRVLKTKNWSTSDIPPAEYAATVAVYATVMMKEYQHLEPMYRFFAAMRDDCVAQRGKITKNNAMLRDLYIKEHGEVGTDKEVLSFVPEPPEFLDGGRDYAALARVHAGACSEDEWASMCGITTLKLHGLDLACYLPESWVA